VDDPTFAIQTGQYESDLSEEEFVDLKAQGSWSVGTARLRGGAGWEVAAAAVGVKFALPEAVLCAAP